MSGTRVLADRYELGKVLGRGGMAEVYVGWDSRLGRDVAIKLLRTGLAGDARAQTRFRREAQSAAALNHPAIVAVYDSGEEPIPDLIGAVSPMPYIVMEFVPGQSVRDLLKTGLPDVDGALEITSGVLSGLVYSHSRGIVHRDIKPGNVMITPVGQVKVMDFGIARALAGSLPTITRTSAVMGTAEYLSPEQARGEKVDTRSDLYSTGCLLYELLTGRPPFVGDSPVAVVEQHVRQDPQPPSLFNPTVPPDLDQVLMQALAKDRTSRYQTAEEFHRDIGALWDRRRPSTAPATSPDREVDERGDTLPFRAQGDDEAPDGANLSDRHQRTLGYRALVGGVLAVVALVVWLVASNLRGNEPVASGTVVTTSQGTGVASPGRAVPAASTTRPTTATTGPTAVPGHAAPATSSRRVTTTSTTPTSTSASHPVTAVSVPSTWSGPCTGEATLANSWPGGYQALITIRNTAGTATQGPWTATVPLPSGQTLSNGWAATLGGTGTATATAKPSPAAPLAAGQTASFYIQVKASTAELPKSIRVSGVACAAG